MPISKTPRTVLASTTVVPGTPQYGSIGLQSAYGGLLTIKIENGGTGPTAPVVCNVLIAHTATLLPTGPAGAVWKTLYAFTGSTINGDIIERAFPIDPAVMALSVEFKGNTGSNVTCEALLSEITSA